MKFTLIKERKSPPDRRVVFSPETFLQAKTLFPSATFTVESSDIRVFSDQDYEKHGLLIEKKPLIHQKCYWVLRKFLLRL